MTKEQKEEVLTNIRKKDNLAYWDEIDSLVTEFMLNLAKYSYSEVNCYYDEDDEDEREITDEFLWLINDVRDFAVKFMEKDADAWFPYVDEDY
jgi:hypothetical protein